MLDELRGWFKQYSLPWPPRDIPIATLRVRSIRAIPADVFRALLPLDEDALLLRASLATWGVVVTHSTDEMTPIYILKGVGQRQAQTWPVVRALLLRRTRLEGHNWFAVSVKTSDPNLSDVFTRTGFEEWDHGWDQSYDLTDPLTVSTHV